MRLDFGAPSAPQGGDTWNLGSSTLVGWISVGLTAVAVFLAVYYYRKSRKFKRLAYVVTTSNLIQDYSATLQDLKIEFRGNVARNISVSKVAIWDDGTETIHGSD